MDRRHGLSAAEALPRGAAGGLGGSDQNSGTNSSTITRRQRLFKPAKNSRFAGVTGNGNTLDRDRTCNRSLLKAELRLGGGTESGTVAEDSSLGRLLELLSSLSESERELLIKLAGRMGSSNG